MRRAGERASERQSTYNPVTGLSGALTVQVVDGLDAGGLGLDGVHESEVVEHGFDDRHVVLVLPHCRKRGRENQSMRRNEPSDRRTCVVLLLTLTGVHEAPGGLSFHGGV